MARGDLRARTGRAAPWILALAILSMLGQAVATAWVMWGVVRGIGVNLDFARPLTEPTVGFLAMGATGFALVALTAIATLGGNRAVVIASIMGVPTAVALIAVAFYSQSAALQADTSNARFLGLIFLVTIPPILLAGGLSIAGFGYSLGRSVPGLKRQRLNRGASEGDPRIVPGAVFEPEHNAQTN